MTHDPQQDALAAWASRPTGPLSDLYATAEQTTEIHAWLADLIARVRADERERGRDPHRTCTSCWMNEHDACTRGEKCLCRACDDERGYQRGRADERERAADPTLSRTVTDPATGEPDVWGQGWACLREADRIDGLRGDSC